MDATTKKDTIQTDSVDCPNPVASKQQVQHSDLQCMECPNSVVQKKKGTTFRFTVCDTVKCANPVAAKEQVQQ